MTGLVLVACSGGNNQVAPISIDPTVVVASTHVDTTATPTTVSAATAVATLPTTTEPATTTADALTGPMFSDALGVKVDTAPGLNTRGDTRQLLPEGLYVHLAWEQDPNDPSVFSPRPEDIPILEAYTNAATTFYAAATSTVTTDGADFATYFVDGGAKFDAAFTSARSGGYVDQLGQGVTLRPYVLHDLQTATTAVVLDCSLSFEQWVSAEVPYAPMSSAANLGVVSTMVLVGEHWLTDTVSDEASACL